MSACACEGRLAKLMGGRTSGSAASCEAGRGFEVVKARVVHCERGPGALRQACRSGVAIGVGVVDCRLVVYACVWSSPRSVSKSRDGQCSCPAMVC
jgi:hypothetical protein